MHIFEPDPSGTIKSKLPQVLPDLAQNLAEILSAAPVEQSNPQVYSDSADQELWNDIYTEDIQNQIRNDFQLAALVIVSDSMTVAELEALSRALNTLRMEHFNKFHDPKHPLYEVLSGLVSEATDTLLGLEE